MPSVAQVIKANRFIATPLTGWPRNRRRARAGAGRPLGRPHASEPLPAMSVLPCVAALASLRPAASAHIESAGSRPKSDEFAPPAFPGFFPLRYRRYARQTRPAARKSPTLNRPRPRRPECPAAFAGFAAGAILVYSRTPEPVRAGARSAPAVIAWV